MGLSEVHQVLTLNRLRHNITLRTDGGIKTGRDVVIAAILGAEEFGVGTASLVAMGCIMVSQCHSTPAPDRKSGEQGKSVSVRLDLGGCGKIKQKTIHTN